MRELRIPEFVVAREIIPLSKWIKSHQDVNVQTVCLAQTLPVSLSLYRPDKITFKVKNIFIIVAVIVASIVTVAVA